MKKLAFGILFTSLQTVCFLPNLQALDTKHFDQALSVSTSEEKITINVSTASELNAAILAASTDLNNQYTILINNAITGNFQIPLTIHTLKLIGNSVNAGLNGNSAGTTLVLDYGAKVLIQDLVIYAASNTGTGIFSYGYGIFNQGKLEIKGSTIANNGVGGILNYGRLEITHSNINDNAGDGIDNEGGILTIKDSIVSGNIYGIYTEIGNTKLNNVEVKLSSSGGLYNYYGATVDVKNSTIHDNTGYGIYTSYAGPLSISDSSIINNAGDGLYTEGTATTVDNSIFNQNTGTGITNYEYSTIDINHSKINLNTDGGLYNYYAQATLNHSQVLNNSTTTSGGGIYNGDFGIVYISRSEIKNNTAQLTGAGIYNFYNVTVYDSKIDDNTAQGNGGGLFNDTNVSDGYEFSRAIIKNSDVKVNHTSANGGGIYNVGLVTVYDSKVNRNTAGVSGGGIYSNALLLHLIDSEVVNNTPDQIAP